MASPPAPRPPAGLRSPGNIFSDDETEKVFLTEVGWDLEEKYAKSLMPYDRIHNIPWVRGEKLGEGGYGTVYVGRRTTDQKLFAVKSVRVHPWPLSEDADELQFQIKEIKMMRRLKYKYIVRCLGCGRSTPPDRGGGGETLDVFLEYITRGSLQNVTDKRGVPFEEDPFVRQYTYDVLKALQFMKKKHVVHGDIKMENLLVSDDSVKLADWGGAKVLRGDNLKETLIGSIAFKPPEVEDEKFQDYSSDVYSLGCTVIQMLTSNHPSSVSTQSENEAPAVIGEIKIKKYRTYIPDTVSPMCADFLKLCLKRDAEDRWSARELLLHPFIANRDKYNLSPYQTRIPRNIGAPLLTHPHPGFPVLSDPVTRSTRVDNHLKTVPQAWLEENAEPVAPPGFENALYGAPPEFDNALPPVQARAPAPPGPQARAPPGPEYALPRAQARAPSESENAFRSRLAKRHKLGRSGPATGVYTGDLVRMTNSRDARDNAVESMEAMNREVIQDCLAVSKTSGENGDLLPGPGSDDEVHGQNK